MKEKMLFLSQSDGGAGNNRKTLTQPTTETIQTQTKKKVVIVDDEPMLVKAVSRALAQSKELEIPANISHVCSLEGAKKSVDEHKPDIIISDKEFDMNNRNAHLELLAYVRKQHPLAKVILHTSYVEENELNAGYDFIAQKPVESARLIEIVERLAKKEE